MSIGQLQREQTKLFEAHLLDLDNRDALMLEDANAAWAHAVAKLTKDTYALDRTALSKLVSSRAIDGARWFQAGARDHVASELGAIVDEARRTANRASTPPLDEEGIRTTADGLLGRLDALVETSKDVPATLLAEAHQVIRIVNTEAFTAYNRTRAEMALALLLGGDRASYLVTTDRAQDRDAGDWVPAILKRWSASLDRQTCARCRGVHGAIRLLGMPFNEPDPPAHARCRCVVGFWPIAVPRKQ